MARVLHTIPPCRRLRLKRDIASAESQNLEYRLAEPRRTTAAAWDDIDVLVVPSVPDVCTLADVAADSIGANSRLGTYTDFVNLLHLVELTIRQHRRGGAAPAPRPGRSPPIAGSLRGSASAKHRRSRRSTFRRAVRRAPGGHGRCRPRSPGGFAAPWSVSPCGHAVRVVPRPLGQVAAKRADSRKTERIRPSSTPWPARSSRPTARAALPI